MQGPVEGLLRIQLGGALNQWINLIALPRHFGGRQWFFECPMTGRRASVLWMPPELRASPAGKRGHGRLPTDRNL